MKATNPTNTNTNPTTRISYVLAGKAANQATAKATAAAKAAITAATTAAANGKPVTAKACNRLSVDLTTATAKAATATTADAAKAAAKAAHKVATTAKANEANEAKVTRLAVATAAKELALNSLSVGGAYAYMDATLETWVEMRPEVKSARFERKTTAKKARMQLVIDLTEGGRIYHTVNATASLDFRKIDAALDRKLANRAKKATAKSTTAKKAAKKAA